MLESPSPTTSSSYDPSTCTIDINSSDGYEVDCVLVDQLHQVHLMLCKMQSLQQKKRNSALIMKDMTLPMNGTKLAQVE